MFYDRKMKYIDCFENGERIRGAGFLKLEVRDAICDLEIHVTNMYMAGSFSRMVRVRGRGKERKIGEIYLQQGKGIAKLQMTVAELQAVNAIYIPLGEGKELSSTLAVSEESEMVCGIETDMESHRGTDAEAICSKALLTAPESERKGDLPEQKEVENFLLKEKTTEGGLSKEKITEGGLSKERIIEEELSEERVAEGALHEEQTVENVIAMAIAESVKQDLLQLPTEPVVGEIDEISAKDQMQENASTFTDQMQEENVAATGQIFMENKWKQLASIYQHIKPFHDEREYLSIGPGDFVILKDSYYGLVHNSFLLHGYYNYQHLILTRLEKRGGPRYYVGVPGSYYEREKQVAVMFGFESFECKEEPARNGDYGYYMIPVDI